MLWVLDVMLWNDEPGPSEPWLTDRDQQAGDRL